MNELHSVSRERPFGRAVCCLYTPTQGSKTCWFGEKSGKGPAVVSFSSLLSHEARAVAAWPALHGIKGNAAPLCASTTMSVCVVLVITAFDIAHGFGVIGRAPLKMPKQSVRNGRGWSEPQSLRLWWPVSKENCLVIILSYTTMSCVVLYAVL